MGQAGLAEAGGTVKKHVIQGFSATLGGANGYLEVFLGLILSGELSQMPRPQAGVQRRVLGTGFTRYDASYFVSPPG